MPGSLSAAHTETHRNGMEAPRMSQGIDRRAFSKAAMAATTVATAASLAPGRVLGANDQVRLGFIGVGNRGCQLLKGFLAQPDAQVVALCDVYAALSPWRQYDQVDPRFAGLGKRIAQMPKIEGDVARVKDFRDRPGSQGHRRGRDRHARPLARHPDDRRLQGGQGCLRREAAVDDDRRGAGDGRGGAQVRPDRPGRHAPPLVADVHAARRGGPIRSAGKGHRGAGGVSPAT